MLSGFEMDVILLVGGVIALYAGAEFLVAGAARLAFGLGLRAVTVGVTVIAFVTTAPELFVATIGALTVSPDIGLGAIIGSNIANIGLVLGVAALIRPLTVSDTVMRRHVPFMLAAAVMLVLAGVNGRIGRIEGVLFLVTLTGFTVYLVYYVTTDPAPARNDELPSTDTTDTTPAASELATANDESTNRTPTPVTNRQPSSRSIENRDVGLVIAGLIALVVGSRWLVSGGTGLLSALGFSDLFIGLTILAIGTSLPEFAASAVGAIRGETGFAIGNVVGSNIYNIFAVLGIVAIITPIDVAQSTLRFELPALLLFTVLLVALMGHKRSLSRLDGGILVIGYGIFLYLLFP